VCDTTSWRKIRLDIIIPYRIIKGGGADRGTKTIKIRKIKRSKFNSSYILIYALLTGIKTYEAATALQR
jgi:hypothetical protein